MKKYSNDYVGIKYIWIACLRKRRGKEENNVRFVKIFEYKNTRAK
jgi:hypothetical protein